MIFIFAGNFQQAKDYARSISMSPDDWVYLSNSYKLCGTRGSTVIRIGTWDRRSDAEQMNSMIIERECCVIDA